MLVTHSVETRETYWRIVGPGHVESVNHELDDDVREAIEHIAWPGKKPSPNHH